tara:strand:- start:1811 stop:2461 length:651 start_codon:yes stop_codon:yes gene_type:complete
MKRAATKNERGVLLKITPRKLPSRAGSRARVEKIVATTIEVISNKGLDGFTTNEIAKKAGIPIGSLYQYFPNKQSILYAIMQDWLAEIEERTATFPLEKYAKSSSKRLLEDFSKSVGTYDRYTGKRRKLGQLLISAAATYPELNELYEKHKEFTIDALVVFLHQAGSNWDAERMRKLGHYLFELRNTIYQVPDDVVEEAIYFREVATIALMKDAFK